MSIISRIVITCILAAGTDSVILLPQVDAFSGDEAELSIHRIR